MEWRWPGPGTGGNGVRVREDCLAEGKRVLKMDVVMVAQQRECA